MDNLNQKIQRLVDLANLVDTKKQEYTRQGLEHIRLQHEQLLLKYKTSLETLVKQLNPQIQLFSVTVWRKDTILEEARLKLAATAHEAPSLAHNVIRPFFQQWWPEATQVTVAILENYHLNQL